MRRWLVAFALVVSMVLAILAAPKTHATGDQTVRNGSGDDTVAIQNAVDAATGGTQTSPAHVYLYPQSSVGCYDVSKQGTSVHAIDFDGSDDHISIESNSPGNSACIERSSVPSGNSGTGFRFFSMTTIQASDLRFKDLYLDDRSTVHSISEPGNEDYDHMFYIQDPDVGDASGEGNDFALKLDGLTLTNVEMQNVRGVCFYARYLKNVTMTNVKCIDPTKDGFTFGHGAWGGSSLTTRGTLTDVKATLTGDDALAFNSCFEGHPAVQCGKAGGFNVNGTYTGDNASTSDFTVDSEVRYGAALFSRGGQEVTTNGVRFGHTATGFFAGSVRGSAMLEPGIDSSGVKFSDTKNFVISNSEADGTGETVPHNGVRIDGGDPSGVSITSNRIDYPSSKCDIKITNTVDAGGITWSGNDFHPNTGSTNICDNRP